MRSPYSPHSHTPPCPASGDPRPVSRTRLRREVTRARRGVTLVELLVGLAVAALLIAGVSAVLQYAFGASDSQLARAAVAKGHQRLDARVAEITRIAPQYGDLTTPAATQLGFRKRLASSAVVCAFNGSALTIRLAAAEQAALQAGDSVAVLRTSAAPGAPAWAIAAITNAAPAGGCPYAPAGTTTIVATLAAPLPASEVAVGATTRLWSTRSYTVEADPATAGAWRLVERVNGANPVTIVGPFTNQNVFTYWQDGMGTVAAPSAAATRLVRARFAPIVRQARRDLAAAQDEVLEWPLTTVVASAVRGELPPPTVTGIGAPSCSTPGALNFGDPVNPCDFPPPVAVVTSVAPNPAQPNQVVTFDGSGSYAVGSTIAVYAWVINGGARSGAVVTQSFPAAGTYPYSLQVQNAAGRWSPIVNGTVTVTNPCAPQPSQTQQVACPAGQGGAVTQQRDWSCATNSYGAWYSTGVNTCTACTSETQDVGCAWNETGSYKVLRRDQTATLAGCTWGGWYTAATDCVLQQSCADTRPGAYDNYLGESPRYVEGASYCSALYTRSQAYWLIETRESGYWAGYEPACEWHTQQYTVDRTSTCARSGGWCYEDSYDSACIYGLQAGVSAPVPDSLVRAFRESPGPVLKPKPPALDSAARARAMP